jgi:hypothetical protein
MVTLDKEPSSWERPARWRRLLVILFCLSAALLLFLRANIGFFLDDWYLVLLRDGPADWLLPHNEHIIVLPAAIYELSLSVFGMDAFPLHLVALTLFLVSVFLLFLWLRPLVGEPVSVLGCAVVLFLGAATGDLIFAFQTGFFGSVAGGLGALVLLRRRSTGADAVACLLLVLSTLFSTLMAPFLAAALVELLYRDSGRPDPAGMLRKSWIVAVPVLVYLAWYAGWNQEGSQQASIENALKAPLYVLSALGFSAASLTGAFPLRGLVDSFIWALPGIAVAVGFILILRRRGSVPPAFLVGLSAGLAFWLLCALNYTEARDFYTSRYQYPSVIFLLMMLAGAFSGLRPDAKQLRWLSGLTVIAVALNLATLIYAFNNVYKPYEEKNLVNLAAIDLAWDTVDRDFLVSIGTDDEGKISAGSYKDAVGRYGRPDLSEEDLTSASSENREKLDQLLVLGLPVEILPASAVRKKASSCQEVEADPTASVTVPVDFPLLFIRPDEDVLIYLGRFADGAKAVAWPAAGGRATGYRIPPDRSDLPWRIGFRGEGTVKVCAAGPAPAPA